MARLERRRAAGGEDAGPATCHRADGPHQECLVVAHGEVAEDAPSTGPAAALEGGAELLEQVTHDLMLQSQECERLVDLLS